MDSCVCVIGSHATQKCTSRGYRVVSVLYSVLTPVCSRLSLFYRALCLLILIALFRKLVDFRKLLYFVLLNINIIRISLLY